MKRMLIAAVLLPLCVGAGCASFATVRSAEVTPGLAVVVQASVASLPGGELAQIECGSCAAAPVSGDVAFAYGLNGGSHVPFTIGAGMTGTYPYLEGYAHLGRGKMPFGIGARAGIPPQPMMHELYGRLDIPLARWARVLWNPGVVYLSGHSSGTGGFFDPSGSGWFIGTTQGVGIQFGAGNFTLTPSAALVFGRADQMTGRDRFGTPSRAFGTAALSIGLRDKSDPLPARRPPTTP